MEFGIWEFRVCKARCRGPPRPGLEFGYMYLEFGNFEFARSAGGQDWNLESGNFEFARSAGGRDWNIGIWNFAWKEFWSGYQTKILIKR